MTTFPVKTEDLETLAAARAKAVQDYLLAHKIDPFRLFLKQPDAGAVRGEGSRAYIEFR